MTKHIFVEKNESIHIILLKIKSIYIILLPEDNVQ